MESTLEDILKFDISKWEVPRENGTIQDKKGPSIIKNGDGIAEAGTGTLGGNKSTQTVDQNPTISSQDAQTKVQQTIDAWQKIAINLDPKVAVTLFDSVVSNVGTMVCRVAGYQVKRSEFQLTESEKDILGPFMSVFIVEWLKTLKPTHVFYILLAVIYGNKVITVVDSQVRLTEEDKKKIRKRNTESRIEETIKGKFENDLPPKKGPGRPRKNPFN